MKKMGRAVPVAHTSEWLPDYGADTVDVVTNGLELEVIR